MTSPVVSLAVAGDQGVACARIVEVPGAVIWTEVPICCHPMPNSPHDSVCGLDAPMRRS